MPILINGEISNHIHVLDRGLLYGDGLFETLAIRQRRIFLWHEHMQRLESGCKALAIDFPGKALLENELARLLDERQDDVTVRVTLTRGLGRRGYRPVRNTQPSRIISLHGWPDSPQEYVTNGIRLRRCDTRLGVSDFAGIKHLNRLEQVIAQSEWQPEEDIQEGLMLDRDQHVIEGTMTNVFIVKEGRLITPDLSQSGVTGVMRQCIIDLAQEQGVDIEVLPLYLDDINNAEEVFVTNSVIGLWPVKEFANKQWVAPGKLTKNIMSLIENKRLTGGIVL